MIQEVDNKRLELPDRKEITLCEAVTVFVYGEALDSLSHSLNNETATKEQRTKARSLVERLRSAAYAGRIKFRGLKSGADHTDGHNYIDNLYFSEPRGLRWEADEIWSGAPSRRFPEFEPRPPNFTMDWHHVHLEREQFAALLRDEGVSFEQGPVVDPPGKRKTFRTGMPGRPTSKPFVLDIARRRLDAGNYPPKLAEFSRQVVEELKITEPEAVQPTPKTVSNAIGELWRARRKPPKIIDPS